MSRQRGPEPQRKRPPPPRPPRDGWDGVAGVDGDRDGRWKLGCDGVGVDGREGWACGCD
ncbi:MAG: hypothetical protein JNJ59_24670 [Deltaproteobacteria bacterium]|nr:hypothetical protein [Deltaproteobacteria bacterium]